MSKILNLITNKEIQRDEEIRRFIMKVKFMEKDDLDRALIINRKYLCIATYFPVVFLIILFLAELAIKICWPSMDETWSFVILSILDSIIGFFLTKKLNKTEDFYTKKVDLINEELTEREKKKLRL